MTRARGAAVLAGPLLLDQSVHCLGITGKKEQGEDEERELSIPPPHPIPRLDPNLRGACSLRAGSLVQVRGKFFWRRSPHPASHSPRGMGAPPPKKFFPNSHKGASTQANF